MKFPHLFKVHQISSNLQNLLETSSETCMWNLSPFGEVKIFHEKMPTVPAIENYEISKSFQSSPNFIKLTEFIGIIIWNMHVRFNTIRKSLNFHEKMPTVPAIEKLWNFHIFSKFTKFHQTYRIYLNHHLKHACKIWVHSEKFKFFMKKSWQCRTAIEILWNFHIFSKFTKFHQTYRIYWNHHLKLACEIWVHSGKFKIFMKKCRQCRL